MHKRRPASAKCWPQPRPQQGRLSDDGWWFVACLLEYRLEDFEGRDRKKSDATEV